MVHGSFDVCSSMPTVLPHTETYNERPEKPSCAFGSTIPNASCLQFTTNYLLSQKSLGSQPLPPAQEGQADSNSLTMETPNPTFFLLSPGLHSLNPFHLCLSARVSPRLAHWGSSFSGHLVFIRTQQEGKKGKFPVTRFYKNRMDFIERQEYHLFT